MISYFYVKLWFAPHIAEHHFFTWFGNHGTPGRPYTSNLFGLALSILIALTKGLNKPLREVIIRNRMVPERENVPILRWKSFGRQAGGSHTRSARVGQAASERPRRCCCAAALHAVGGRGLRPAERQLGRAVVVSG